MNLIYSLLLVIFATVIGAYGSLFFKLSSDKISFNLRKLLKNYQLFIGFFLYGISSIIFLFALKGADLSVVYPFVSFSYVWVTILSVKHLKEKMNPWKYLGIFPGFICSHKLNMVNVV